MILKSINISIIAHVDHGKTTLLNSLINFCKKYINYEKNFFFKNNYFYTIKINIFSIILKNLIINFIDCPGHFDFINEIYKIILISEFCYILIDIIKGIEPQTLFCYNLSKKFKKKIFIFINKIDIFINLKNIKNKLFFFNKKEKIFFLSSKYNIGIKNIFNIKINKKYKKEKVIFVIDKINNIKYGFIIISKIISGCILNNTYLKNNKNIYIKILKIGIFLPKNFFLKKTYNNCIHFFFINKHIDSNFFFFKKKKIKIKKFISILYYTLYIKNDFFLIKLLNNDFFIFIEKNESFLFGENYFLGFIGNLHSEIFFKKLKIFSFFWVTNPIIFFLLNNKKYWFFDKKNICNFTEYEQIVLVKLYILKKNFFLIIQYIFLFNYYKIKILYLKNLIIIVFYINLYKIVNGFFLKLNKIINGFIFYEFDFHHFLKSKLFFIQTAINNELIHELSFILEDNIINNCIFFFNKIKKNISKNLIDINIKFFFNKKIILSKKIFCLKKNVIEKCYGGDITRKIKLLKKQKKGKKMLNKFSNFFLNKKILINIIKNELSNI